MNLLDSRQNLMHVGDELPPGVDLIIDPVSVEAYISALLDPAISTMPEVKLERVDADGNRTQLQIFGVHVLILDGKRYVTLVTSEILDGWAANEYNYSLYYEAAGKWMLHPGSLYENIFSPNNTVLKNPDNLMYYILDVRARKI